MKCDCVLGEQSYSAFVVAVPIPVKVTAVIHQTWNFWCLSYQKQWYINDANLETSYGDIDLGQHWLR